MSGPFQFINKIHDQVGYIIMKDDGAIVAVKLSLNIYCFIRKVYEHGALKMHNMEILAKISPDFDISSKTSTEVYSSDSANAIRDDYAKLIQKFAELSSDDNYVQYLRFNIEQTELLKAKIAEVDDELNDVTSRINNQLQLHTDTTLENIHKCQESLAQVQEKLDSVEIIGQVADFLDELDETGSKWSSTSQKHSGDLDYWSLDSMSQSVPVRRAFLCQKGKEIVENLIRNRVKIRLDLNNINGEKLAIDRHSLDCLKNEFLSHEDRLKYQIDQVWAEVFKTESSVPINTEIRDDQRRIFEENRITIRLKAEKSIFAEMGASMLVLEAGNQKFRHLEAKVKQLAGFFFKSMVKLSPKTMIDYKIEEIGHGNVRISSIFSLAEETVYDGEKLLTELRKLIEKLGSLFDIDFSTKIVENIPDELTSSSSKSQKSTKNFDYSLKNSTSSENSDVLSIPDYKKNFKSFFGHYLFDDLLKSIVENILKPELLASADFQAENQFSEKFTSLLTTARHFKAVMIKSLDVKQENSEEMDELNKFSSEIEKLYMAAKCQNVLSAARRLIMDPNLHDTVDVDVQDHQDSEDVKVESKTENPSTSDWDWDDWEADAVQSIKPACKFQPCKVSITIQKFSFLIRDTLYRAESVKSTTEAEQLVNLARYCFESFVAIYMDSHREHMHQMPLNYALVHNNCQYLAHMATIFASRKSDLKDFADYAPILKTMAENCWTKFTNERKQSFLECLKPAHFSNLSDNKILAACRKTLKQCLLQIQSLNRSWIGVWPTVVSLKASSHFARLILNALVDKITIMEDITASDTYLIKEIFEEFLYELEAIFTINKSCHIQRFCRTEYSKFKELIFVLSSNLQEIEDRWINGPLAKLMSADEVKRLIRALFQNTDKRANILQKIK